MAMPVAPCSSARYASPQSQKSNSPVMMGLVSTITTAPTTSASRMAPPVMAS